MIAFSHYIQKSIRLSSNIAKAKAKRRDGNIYRKKFFKMSTLTTYFKHIEISEVVCHS